MQQTINIDFDNSSSVILGYHPDILSGTQSTGYAWMTHTHGSVLLNLENITGTYTSVSNGLTLHLSAGSAGGNVVYAGSNITLSTTGVSTTISATGLAQESHQHGGVANAVGNIAGTISSNGWSLSIPDFLLTENITDHSHTNYIGLATSTVTVAGTNLTLADDSLGLTIGVPKMITTAALSNHTHGNFAGTNIYLVSSGSAGLALSAPEKMGTATTLSNIPGSVISGVGNTSGLTLGIPSWITTAAEVSHSHGDITTASVSGTDVTYSSASNGLTLGIPQYVTDSQTAETWNTSAYIFSGFSSTSVHESGIPYGISVTASPGNLMTLSGNTLGTMELLSSGTVNIAGGDNITLSQDGNAFTIIGAASGTDAGIAFSMSTSNTSGTATLVSSGTLYLQGGANITVSQEANTLNIIGNTAFPGLGSSIANGSMTYNTDGLTISIPSGTAANVVETVTGGFVSLSVDDISTTVSVTGLQAVADMTNYVNVSNTTDFMNATEPHINEISLSGNTSGTITDISSGTVYLAGGNNITLSQEGNSITISGVTVHAQQTGISGIAGSAASTVTSGTVRFNNANGISFGLNGNTMTASWASDDYIGTAYLNYFQATSNNSLSAAASHTHGSIYTAQIAGSVVTNSSASSGLTLGIPAYITTVMDHTHGSIYTVANTTGTDIKNSSASSGITLSVPPYAVTSHTHSNLYMPLGYSTRYAGILTTGITGADATINSSGIQIDIPQGSIYYEDSPGISFGATSDGLSTTITASVNLVTGAIAAASLSGNTSGTLAEINSGTVIFKGGSNITLSQDANTIEIIGAAGGTGGTGGIQMRISGNTLGTTAMISTGTLTLVGSNNVTLTQNGNLVGIIGASSFPNMALKGSGTYTQSSGTVEFRTGNGLTFGLASPGIITASHNAFVSSSQLSSAFAGLVHTHTSNSLYFADSNGISWGADIAGYTTTVTADYTRSSAFVQNSETGNVYFMNPISTGGVTSGSNITFGSSVGGNNTSIFATAGGGTGGGGGIGSFLLSGNTTGNTTASGSTIQFYAGDNIVISGTNDSVIRFDVPDNAGSLYFSDGSGITFGVDTDTNSHTTVTASILLGGGNWKLEGANTGGNTSTSFQTLYLSGGSNVTLSGNSNTIAIHVNASGAADGGNILAVSGSTANTTGTVALWNSNNITFGITDNTRITASHKVAQLDGTITANDRLFIQNTVSNIILSQEVSSNSVHIDLDEGVNIEARGGSGASYSNLGFYIYDDSIYANMATASVTGGTWENQVNIVFHSNSGLAYLSDGTFNNSRSTVWSTLPNWIPNKKYVDAQISTVTATGGAGNLSITAGTVSGTRDALSFANANNVSFTMDGSTISASINKASIYFTDGGGLSWSASTSGVNTTAAASIVTSYLTGSFVNTGAAHIRGIGNSETTFTSGSVMLSGENLTVNSSLSGATQYMQISGPTIGFLYFSNVIGLSWSSSVSGINTSIYAVIP